MSDEEPQLRVTVEMSDDFEPGDRTAAALADLVQAIEDEHGDDDVAGFGASPSPLRSFTLAVMPGGLTHDPVFEQASGKWKMASFDGKGNDVVTEEITF